jgi:hypothetical protein
MNENKKGRKFVYPDSFILVVGYMRIYFHLPYRQTEGIIKATGKSLPSHPSYGHMCKRVKGLKADFNSSIKTNDDDDLMIAIDSTGVRVTNRGQWMSEKWGWRQEQKEEGYLKIHVVVNTKTKEILALEVTDEKVHDGTMMKKLVKHVLNGHHHGEKVKSVLADGAYDSNANFRFLDDEIIKPAIKVKRIPMFQPKTAKPGMAKSGSKQEISSNGKGKEGTVCVGWPNLHLHP